jgi:hypothetical protein
MKVPGADCSTHTPLGWPGTPLSVTPWPTVIRVGCWANVTAYTLPEALQVVPPLLPPLLPLELPAPPLLLPLEPPLLEPPSDPAPASEPLVRPGALPVPP